jgi:magnesium chelatase family protein
MKTQNSKKLIKVYAGFRRGIETAIYQITINTRPGLPVFEILAVNARLNRIFLLKLKSIFNYLNFSFPFGTITICLQKINSGEEGLYNCGHFPYDLEKMEFPIAVALLCLTEQIRIPGLNKCLLFGSLDLEGNICGIKDPRAIITHSLKCGINRFILPLSNKRHGTPYKKMGKFVYLENLNEISEVPIHELYPTAQSDNILTTESSKNGIVRDAISGNNINSSNVKSSFSQKIDIYSENSYTGDYSDVLGLDTAKRALSISACGKHHLILYGPPGCGKTMLAVRFPTILPEPTKEESWEIEQIVEEAIISGVSNSIWFDNISNRPFRSPHHTVSHIGLTGGTSSLKLGEFTLAHNGVLFFDELGEFYPNSIQVLREVLTHKRIEISRASGRISYPANFWFIGAFNLCPCGFFGHPVFSCACSPTLMKNYLKKIQGPFIDRMDLQISLSPPNPEILKNHSNQSSKQLNEKIKKGRILQVNRLNKYNLNFNGDIPDSLAEKLLTIPDNIWKEFYNEFLRNGLYSSRELISIKKTARTIADLDEAENIHLEHLTEALSYKQFRKEMKIIHGDYDQFIAEIN